MSNLRTRSKTNLWFISIMSENILGAGLPTNEAVLKYFFFLHKDKGFTIKDSAKHTVQEVLSFWGKAKIPTQRKDSCQGKLITFFNSYQKLQKSRYKTQTSYQKKEELFVDKLGELFDVAAQNALSLMSNKDDRKFLLMQRNGPTSCSMAGRDMSLAAFEDRNRKQNELKKKPENREKDRKNCDQTAEFEDYCSSDSQDDLSFEECSSEAPCPSKKKL